MNSSCRLVFGLCLLCAVISCADPDRFIPASRFDGPFPKKNLNLPEIVGSGLLLKRAADTLHVRICSGESTNTLIDARTQDTLFHGSVSRFRNLYYFSQAISDTSYWIFAVRISGREVYGLREGWTQMYQVDHLVKAGHSPKLVKHVNADSSVISLRAERRGMRRLYEALVSTLKPDTIIHQEVVFPSVISSNDTLPENGGGIIHIYPNPAEDFVNVVIADVGSRGFTLSDSKGRIVQRGTLSDTSLRLDLRDLRPGLFYLSVFNPSQNRKEVVRIVKSE